MEITIFIIYCLGVIVSAKLLMDEYENTPEEQRCSSSEAVAVISINIIFSWITVIEYLIRKNKS